MARKAQVSPSGMAAASQAVPGEFDSRHLLQKDKRPLWGVFLFGTANAVKIVRLSHAKLFFAFGHAHAYLSAFAYLAPKKRYQRFSYRVARRHLLQKVRTHRLGAFF